MKKSNDKDNMLYFVKIKYNDKENDKEYSFLCDDVTVKKGDFVLVPRENDNVETVAVVTSTEFRDSKDVKETKSVIGKITVDSQNFIDNDKTNLKNEKIEFKLSNSDFSAVNDGMDNFLNNKGAKLYENKDYERAIEYYRLAAAMGNTQAVSNLGYCYLYGRSIKPNTELAIQYFKIAAHHDNLDAICKLGDIYRTNEWNMEDKEQSLYYYKIADDIFQEKYSKIYCFADQAMDYPTLFYVVGKESMPGGDLEESIEKAFVCLKTAEKGYEKKLENNVKIDESCLNAVKRLLDNPIFDDIKEQWNEKFESGDMGDIEF